MKIIPQRIVFITHHLIIGGILEIFIAISTYLFLNTIGWNVLLSIIISLFPFILGFYRTTQWAIRKWGIESLGVSNFTSITLNSIEKIKQDKQIKNKIYLGDGFIWGPEHCQAFYEVDQLPEKEKYFTPIAQGGGIPYTHNIGNIINKKSVSPIIIPLPEHTALIGSTGVGKTRTFELIIAQLIKNNYPVIIIDPKSDKDLLDAVYQCCLDSERENKFDYISLAHPQISSKLNPFSSYNTASEIANRITSIMPKTGNSQPFIDFCGDVLSTVVGILILMNKQITLKSLYRYAVLKREELLDMAIEYQKSAIIPDEASQQVINAIEELAAKIDHDKAHYQKMTTSLMPILKSLTTGNIGGILNPNGLEGISWASILEDKRIVYFSLASMKDGYVSSNVGKLIVQDLIAYIGDRYTKTNNPVEFYLLVDETYSVIYDGYVDILNKTRAAGLHLILGLQTTADIEAKLSDPVRRQIYGNIATKIYMRVPDSDQAEEVIKTLGTCQIPKRTQTRNVGATLDSADDLFKSGFSERVDQVETELLPASALTSLPKGQAFVVAQGTPYKIKIPLLDRAGLPKVSFFDRVTRFYEQIEITKIGSTLFGDIGEQAEPVTLSEEDFKRYMDITP